MGKWKNNQVHDAGHMVPMDQPKAALEMLKRWTQGTLSETAAEPEILVAQMWSRLGNAFSHARFFTSSALT